MQRKQINITVELDEQHIPTNIIWNADDMQGKSEAECRAMLLSLWDARQKDTLKLDLWTKDMTVDEMKIFFHQTLVTMASTLQTATNDERIAGDMQDFCDYFAEKMEIKA
ncbi:MAG: gliding motility protein GldC [Balneolales bacterium]|nr:gliding motility protein GldC [Balneolales bacterium]